MMHRKLKRFTARLLISGSLSVKADEAERLNTELQETVGSIQAEYETKADKGDALLLISTAPIFILRVMTPSWMIFYTR